MLRRFLHNTALLLVLLAMPGLVACQKKCQATSTQSFGSLVDTPWRLVQTTDPQVSTNLDNYNFLILSFARNNTGDVKRVVDNDQYDQPVQTIVWVPNVSAKSVKIQYTSSAGTAGDDGTFTYSYALGRQLEMTDTKGNYYRYVPFQGVVDPDVLCSF